MGQAGWRPADRIVLEAGSLDDVQVFRGREKSFFARTGRRKEAARVGRPLAFVAFFVSAVFRKWIVADPEKKRPP